MGINEYVMRANFGILGHVIVNWHTKKQNKSAIFGLKIY